MKLTSSITALAAILGLALASAPVTLQAQTTTTPAPAAAPAKAKKDKPKTIEYTGNITAIDATSVTIASTAKVLTLSIAPTTKYKKDKAAATIADFAVGDKVTGSYTKDATGAMTAYSLHKKTVTVASATKTAKTSATSTVNSALNSATPAAVPAPAKPAGM